MRITTFLDRIRSNAPPGRPPRKLSVLLRDERFLTDLVKVLLGLSDTLSGGQRNTDNGNGVRVTCRKPVTMPADPDLLKRVANTLREDPECFTHMDEQTYKIVIRCCKILVAFREGDFLEVVHTRDPFGSAANATENADLFLDGKIGPRTFLSRMHRSGARDHIICLADKYCEWDLPRTPMSN